MSNTSSPHNSANKSCESYTLLWIDQNLKPRSTVNFVEGCVTVAALFLLILLVLGPWRCRSRSVVVQYSVMAAHVLSFSLLSYSMGLMKGAIKNERYPVWALFLVLVFAGANSVSVLKLDENKQVLKLLMESSQYLVYAGTIWNSIATIRFLHPCSLILKLLINVLLPLRNCEMLWARQLASDPWWNGSRAVDLNMKYYELALSPCYNPRSMEGYSYLVFPLRVDLAARPSQDDIQRARSELVTLEKIWCHGDGVLQSMDSHPAIHHLKDVCLSFALFRLAVRRYHGYPCPESGLDKARDLVLQGLLHEGSCDRAFRVIEIELAFLYEFFFTKYAIIVTCLGAIMSIAFSVATITIIVSLGIYFLTHLKGGGDSLTPGFVQLETRDIILTKLMLWSLGVFQLLKNTNMVVSNWAQVYLLCRYITRPSWQGNKYIDRLLLFVGKLSIFLEQHKLFGPWGNRMGQYSFMDSFNHPSHGLEKFKEWIITMFQGGRKEGTSIPVPAEVKKAVAWTLKDSNGLISNGSRALGRCVMTELYSSCQTNNEITLAHVIMIWHIATWHFEISESIREDTVQETNRLVATSLSKYCAYLVAFAPELVPGSPIQTQSMLDELVADARKALRGASDMYKRL
ncbi:hypothetical protein PVAP13_4KG268600 [Panicum virgatum]|uniref:DUF4220 domain-containing protein n=2 Tax=Panicum virgatum TaxID=38727 RepID=A0A8T0TT46_PANVG|nr:hypothetical protein PVAP13_4KG268600 [Panicum virgatum]